MLAQLIAEEEEEEEETARSVACLQPVRNSSRVSKLGPWWHFCSL